jgi:biopolymer transport protein TolR
MSDINVTPFVDVMLVLLIVFMVAAPLLAKGVPIELPKTAANELNEDKEPLTVIVGADGIVYLQDTPIGIDDIVPRLLAIAENGYDQRIFLRADRSVDYGRVMEVMGLLNAAGFTQLGLVTDPLPAGAKAPTPRPADLDGQ